MLRMEIALTPELEWVNWLETLHAPLPKASSVACSRVHMKGILKWWHDADLAKEGVAVMVRHNSMTRKQSRNMCSKIKDNYVEYAVHGNCINARTPMSEPNWDSRQTLLSLIFHLAR